MRYTKNSITLVVVSVMFLLLGCMQNESNLCVNGTVYDLHSKDFAEKVLAEMSRNGIKYLKRSEKSFCITKTDIGETEALIRKVDDVFGPSELEKTISFDLSFWGDIPDKLISRLQASGVDFEVTRNDARIDIIVPGMHVKKYEEIEKLVFEENGITYEQRDSE